MARKKGRKAGSPLTKADVKFAADQLVAKSRGLAPFTPASITRSRLAAARKVNVTRRTLARKRKK